MLNSLKNILIVSPHADDEIFTLPFILSENTSFDNIDFLVIENDKKRYKEAEKSAKLNKFNFKIYEGTTKADGECFHKIIFELSKYFDQLWEKYDAILSPMIEGGHQDHDSTSIALLHSKEKQKNKAKLIFYPTYRSSEFLPLLYSCGISKRVPQSYVFKFSMPKDILILIYKNVIFSYKSQYKTWLLLLPTIFFSYVKGNLNKFCYADNISYSEILKLIPNKPLYQTYRNLKREEWFREINKLHNV